MLCVAIVGMLWAALVFDLDRSKKTALAQAGNDAVNLAMTFRENVKRTVSAIDQVMLTVMAENDKSGDPYHIPSWINSSPLLRGMSVQVSIADAAGIMAASSLGSTHRVDLSDRPHFRYHLDPSAPQPYISVPVIGRNSGKWSIQITRRITRSDGSFAGVMIVSLDPEYFSRFFGSVDLGHAGVVDLIGRDGVVRAERARDNSAIGRSASDTPLFPHMQQASTGTDIVQSRLDGVTRIFGFSAVADYPLIVAVGLAMDDVLAPVRWQRTFYPALGAGLTLVIVALGWFLARETRRRRQRELSAFADQKTAEQKLLLDRAVNNMRNGLLMFDSDRRAVVINRSYVELYGLSPAAAKPGCTIRELLEQRAATGTFEGDIDAYIEERFVRDRPTDTTFTLPDGRSMRIVNRNLDDGGWVSIHEDVTQLKQREDSIAALFESNPVPMFVFDAETLKFLAVNDAAIRHYGYSRDQFLAMSKLDIHPLQDLQSYTDIINDFRSSGRADFGSTAARRHRKSDGSEILVHVFGQRMNYCERQAILCSIIDVTERIQVEEERDRNRAFLDRIIDNISLAVLVKDARTRRYLLVNQSSEKLWGKPREEMVGRTPHEIFDKHVADMIEEHDNRNLLDGKSNYFVPAHKIDTPGNGVRLVTTTRIVIRDSGGQPQYLVGVVEDVTDRRSVEEQLRQAQKMEAVGNLTGGVAHDFNNLLTVIIGNLDLLQEDVAGNAEAEEKIGVILDAAERGADLTRHMLAFSRRQPLQAAKVDVNTLIANTTKLLGRTIGAQIAVEVDLAAQAPVALVDPSQLETALLNIALNARDAMPNGGTLTIRSRLAELDEAYVRQHPGVAPGAYAVIEIGDTGSGMSPETLERIFEPFFTTKAAGKGTGLGLSMVYGFIKQSGGHISAYSEIGRGTVFKLFLPLADPAAAAAAEAVVSRPARPAGNEMILAVEDNPDIRATVVRQLHDLGYRVREAENAQAALHILEAGEPIDLLFTDMIMPGEMNGKQLAIKARGKRADLKVLFTSGFLGTSNGAQLDPGDVLLSKPYHKRDLAKAVEQVLQQQRVHEIPLAPAQESMDEPVA